MEKINLEKILHVNYIKLGKKGIFEQECFQKGKIQIDYNEIPHDLCIKKQWEKVKQEIVLQYKCNNQIATTHCNQIKKFYEDGEDVLWITFYENTMWWGRASSNKKIVLNQDKTKTRKITWCNTDIHGKRLNEDRIRGNIRSVQFYQQTICNVRDKDYIVNKINGDIPRNVIECQENFKKIKQNLEGIISGLDPKDFELLVDLIFRQAGWQRIDYAGGILPNIDLVLYSPIINEKIAVQIKSRSNKKEFDEWKSKILHMTQFDRLFYVVHSPFDDLKIVNMDNPKINLLMNEKLSEMALDYGLINWLIKKSS